MSSATNPQAGNAPPHPVLRWSATVVSQFLRLQGVAHTPLNVNPHGFPASARGARRMQAPGGSPWQ